MRSYHGYGQVAVASWPCFGVRRVHGAGMPGAGYRAGEPSAVPLCSSASSGSRNNSRHAHLRPEGLIVIVAAKAVPIGKPLRWGQSLAIVQRLHGTRQQEATAEKQEHSCCRCAGATRPSHPGRSVRRHARVCARGEAAGGKK